MADRNSRVSAEAKIPTASENKKVSNSTSATRQNSPLVIPPVSRVSARTGSTASNPYSPLSEVAAILPSTTSYPFKSVKKSNPIVSSRFSALRQSAVKKRPAPRQYNRATPESVWKKASQTDRRIQHRDHGRDPAEDHRSHPHPDSRQISPLLARGDAQLTLNNRQESHSWCRDS